MTAADRRKLTGMFIVSYIAYSVIYVARLNFSVAASLMESAGVLTNAQIGVIGGAFSLVYALAKVPNGYLGDRLNTKLTVIAGLCIAGLSNIIIGLVPSYLITVIFWGLNAYGQSMLWGPLLRSFSENFPAGVNRKLAPFLASSIGAGSVLGLAVSMVISRSSDSSICFIVPGIICLGAALLVGLFLKGAPGKKSGESESIFRVVVKFLKDRKFRRIIVPAVGHGMVKDNVNVWMVVFFVSAYGVNVGDVAAYVFFIPLCSLAGRLLYPPLLKLVGNIHRLSAVSYAVTAAAAGILCIPGAPMWASAVCLGLIAAFASVLNTHFVTLFPQEYAGENLSFAASTIDLLVYGGAALGSLLYGYIIEMLGFSAMFAVWIICSAVCIPLILRHGRDYPTMNAED